MSFFDDSVVPLRRKQTNTVLPTHYPDSRKGDRSSQDSHEGYATVEHHLKQCYKNHQETVDE